MMHTKLAGHLPLQDLIANVIEGARVKLAAEEPKDEKKEEKVKKLLKYEKKEHGHIPSEKEEEAEKKASTSVIDFSDPDQVEKLASALDQVGGELEKDADSVELGGESRQGGMVLSTMSPVGGKQPYKHDKSRHGNVPTSTGLQKGDDGAASTQVPNDHARAPGAGKAYPSKGVMKTAAEGVMAKIQAAKDKKEGKGEEKEEKKEDKGEEKKASSNVSPVDFILDKMAESPQGGMTLDSKSGEGPKPPAGDGRQLISSNEAVVNAKKVDAKGPQKKLLSQVLTEPALTKSTDSKVHENLRNATKGGVKIAAAKALLQKIAEEGCTCSGKGECKYCKMKTAKSKMEKDSNAGCK